MATVVLALLLPAHVVAVKVSVCGPAAGAVYNGFEIAALLKVPPVAVQRYVIASGAVALPVT